MYRKSSWVVILLMVVSFGVSQLFAEEEGKYLGAKRSCMACHKNPAKGNQWGIWESTDHAKAFETLKTDESKAIAEKMEIEDATTDAKCLKCHVTGYGKASMPTYDQTEGITCEACHGPGSPYKTKHINPKLREDPEAIGLMTPDADDCKVCHNEESPTYKPFKWEEKWPPLAHPVEAVKK